MNKLLVITFTYFMVLMVGCSGVTEQKRHVSKKDMDAGKSGIKEAPKQTTKKSIDEEPVKPDKERRKGTGFLIVDKKVFDFGTVEPRQQVTGQFMLKNDGKEPLTIKKKIGSSCGCLIPKLKTYELKSGESIPLTVHFTADDIPGETTKRAWVVTEPPALPERVSVSVKALVREFVQVSPKEWCFEIREGATSNELPLVLESTDGVPFQVLSVFCRGNAVKADKYPRDKKKKHVVPIKVDLEKLRKIPEGLVTVKINHPKVKKVVRRYKSVLPFAAYPSSKSFFNMKPGDTKKTVIKIISNFGEKFQIDKIISEKGMIKVLKQGYEKDSYRVEIAFTIPKGPKVKKYLKDNLVVTFKGHPGDVLHISCDNWISSVLSKK